MSKAKQDRAWWLESGRERCSACGHSYVYESGYYCSACDEGLCSICVEQTVSVDVLCTRCNGAEEVEA